MKAPGTPLLSSETDLKKLMADVTRAMEKADQAVARITGKGEAAQAAAAAAVPQGA
ncbi:MAG TPA: hypothetical protein VLX44_21595 [Xanthobacteraceae bacterium]|nr:hypothetical protein [Xanthobacteraceae bacterium]